MYFLLIKYAPMHHTKNIEKDTIILLFIRGNSKITTEAAEKFTKAKGEII